MQIEDRVDLYKQLFIDSIALEPVKDYLLAGVSSLDRMERLEKIRELNTDLADLFMVSIPVITCWVRDDSYIPETGEIYLTEPHLGSFLHQFRHHLQNVERKYERRGLIVEGACDPKLPYQDCFYSMRGEDDARAWSRAIVEIAGGCNG